MAASAIEWTQATWNPIAGCSAVSPGCTHCYALAMARRLAAMGMDKYRDTIRLSGGRPVWSGRIAIDQQAMEAPLTWRRPRRVFVNSMSDLFHPAVPAEVIARIWSVMQRADRHIYQILTKRPERMAEIVPTLPALPHVWLGTSVEGSAQAGRLDILRRVPAAVRFVSFEPLIAPVPVPDLTGIDWVIVGGESGPGARLMHPEWVEDIHAAARLYGAAFFFKQWGGPRRKAAGRLLHGRTWDDLPMGRWAA